jgi:predicted nuclease with RNAse H fold
MPEAIRVIAVDWSGRSAREGTYIWQAEHRDGVLVGLRGGREGRVQTIERLIGEAEKTPRLVVGLDFAFSMPSWFLRSQGVGSAYALWQLVETDGERWLASCEPPFWGRTGRKRPQGPESHHFRRTERELRARKLPVKSVFQIGGAGAVGTGSLRGMPYLRRLHDEGFSIWPFDAPDWPRVIEIYPRAFTGGIRKSREAERRRHLTRCDHMPSRLRDPAAVSQDAFDAALSAIAMGRHVEELEALDGNPRGDPEGELEGRIWLPA